MKRLALAFALLLPGATHAGSGSMTQEVPEYRVADPSAPPVTESNLLSSERFWPYQTELAKQWQSLAVGSSGVLIRVEASGLARIDFGRDGLLRVPVAVTDLVARANEIRLGRAEKPAPNVLWAIGARLVDSTSEDTRAFPFGDAASHSVFLCVFADPWRRELAGLVSALAPLGRRAGVQTILFPQSRRPDSQVAGQLRAMKWTPPFVYAHLSEPYTESLLDDPKTLPAVLLVTADGRVLHQGRLSRESAQRLEAALAAQAMAGE